MIGIVIVKWTEITTQERENGIICLNMYLHSNINSNLE